LMVGNALAVGHAMAAKYVLTTERTSTNFPCQACLANGPLEARCTVVRFESYGWN
jgi:hypothetical protein